MDKKRKKALFWQDKAGSMECCITKNNNFYERKYDFTAPCDVIQR